MGRSERKARQARYRELVKNSRAHLLGLVVTDDEVVYGDHRVPLAGARAEVEALGDIERRVTATRLATTGLFAFALKKKRDHRSLFLVVTGRGDGFRMPIFRSQESQARDLAVKINSWAQTGPRDDHPASPPPPPAGG